MFWILLGICALRSALGAEGVSGGDTVRVLAVTASSRAGFSAMAPEQTGLRFTNELPALRAAENQIRMNGSGLALGDVDGDGWCDLVVCGLSGGNRIYRNLGAWRFEDVTRAAGLDESAVDSTGAVLADVDGDGDLDLLLTGIGKGTRLFRNTGAGRFTEDLAAGLVREGGSMSMALADVDGDGDLDLYVANYRTTTIRTTGFAVLNQNGRRIIRPQDREQLEIGPGGRILEAGEPDILYLNQGDGRFSAVPWVGSRFMEADGRPLDHPPRDWGLAVLIRDLNQDGAPDIYVCNDFHTPDRFWFGDGRGTFRAAPDLALRTTPTFSMAIDAADVNRDGIDDLFIADMLARDRLGRMTQSNGKEPVETRAGEYRERLQLDRNTLQLGRGDGTYSDRTYAFGLEASGWTWAVAFLDVDLDGYEDLLSTAGNLFNTQDMDANARIDAGGPYSRENIPRKLLMYPPLLQPQLAFRNMGGRRFEEVGEAWGFRRVGVGHGMALGDLDNDGDLDVVVNALNAPVAVYRNDTDAGRVQVRLRGRADNTRGVGARIRLIGGAVPTQEQEMICGGRYLSSDQAVRTFATGVNPGPMRIEVVWRSGKTSRVDGVERNRAYELAEPMESAGPRGAEKRSAVLFEDASGRLSHRHHEAPFDDFSRQPLLPNRQSQAGPGVAWADIDGDENEDLVVGSGRGGRMGVFLGTAGGGAFVAKPGAGWTGPQGRDQLGVVTYRRENGDVMAIVAATPVEDPRPNTPGVLHSFNLTSGHQEEPVFTGPGVAGVLALTDKEGDGALDLFVGGRALPGRWPEPSPSALLVQREGRWMPDASAAAVLKGVGIVNGSVWTDLDEDGYPELVLACELGPVRVFANRRGQLEEKTAAWGLEGEFGWWNSVAAGDFDGDGRMDLVVGNWGTNSKYRADARFPWRVYSGELGGGMTNDVVEAFYSAELGRWVPDRDLVSFAQVMPFLRETFARHEQFARAGVEQVFGQALNTARRNEVTRLESCVLWNRGGRFEVQPLPSEAQASPVFGISVGDFDGDGREDLVLSQNFFAAQGLTSRSDAGRGLLLRGDGRGGWGVVPGAESGLDVYGEGRGCALADWDRDGRLDLVMTQNGAETRLFRNVGGRQGLRVRVTGPRGNRDGLGARVRLRSGGRWGAAREVRLGSGYLSQDSVVQVLAVDGRAEEVEVRWPGGGVTRSMVPDGAREFGVR